MSEIFRYFEDHPSLFIVAGTIISALCAVAGVCHCDALSVGLSSVIFLSHRPPSGVD